LYEAFRIRPVVESTDENGRVASEAKATLADAQRECEGFDARQIVGGMEGKRIIWSVYGVNPEENDVRTEEAIADRNTEDAARELLANIIGPFIPDEKGYCSAAIVVPPLVIAQLYEATELLEAALSHIEAYRDTEEVDSLASADDCIADAIEALSIKHSAEAKGTGEAATVGADVARTELPISPKQ
jgi:hypothetical protein